MCRPWEPEARPDQGAVGPPPAAAAAAVLQRPCLARAAATRLPPARLVRFSAGNPLGSTSTLLEYRFNTRAGFTQVPQSELLQGRLVLLEG